MFNIKCDICGKSFSEKVFPIHYDRCKLSIEENKESDNEDGIKKTIKNPESDPNIKTDTKEEFGLR